MYRLLFPAFMLLITSVATAQLTTFRGWVGSQDKKNMEGAVVYVFKDNVFQRGTVTSKSGNWHISPLLAGYYKIKIEKQGYETLTKDSVELVAIMGDSINVVGFILKKRPAEPKPRPDMPTTVSKVKFMKSLKETKNVARCDVVAAERGGYATATSRKAPAKTVSPSPPAPALMSAYHKTDDAKEYFAAGASSESLEVVGKPQPAAKAGSLTSGETNDFSKWRLWNDFVLPELKPFQQTWHLYPQKRYSVILKSNAGTPVCGAQVTLRQRSDGLELWQAVTDNTGKAELWYQLYSADSSMPDVYAHVAYNGHKYATKKLKEFHDGSNILEINAACFRPQKLDVAFIVDATGSMQDEINYLKAELVDIIHKVSDSLPNLDIKTASVFYRDHGDDYLTKFSDFSSDINTTLQFINANNADGGGDMPEASDDALDTAMQRLSWREGTVAKIAFLITDAPAHNDEKTIMNLQRLTAAYAKKGIRLVPLACSGADKSTEYLYRAMALATNGTYLFLTNHSGIGGSHTEPTTDKYEVEYMNGLVYKVIYQFSYLPECAPVQVKTDTTSVTQKTDIDSTGTAAQIDWKYYPNPTTGILNIQHKNTEGEIFICDISGKIIQRYIATTSGITTINVSEYPSGIYFIRYTYAADKTLTGKFVLMH